MALPIQLNYYSNADTSIIDLQNTADGVIIGHHQVSLTNYDNTSLPAIAIGSAVENNGAMVKFTTECAISGSPSDGTVYIYLVPSGDPALGTATVTPTFSNVAPAWSDSKQGWYGTGGSANYRYLEFVLYKSSALYTNKYEYLKNKEKKYNYLVTYSLGNITITANAAESVLLYPTLIYDKWTDYNTDTGILSVRKTGYYRIYCDISMLPASTTAIRFFRSRIAIYKNAGVVKRFTNGNVRPETTAGGARAISVGGNFVVLLSVGDTITIYKDFTCSDTSNTNVAENCSTGDGGFFEVEFLGDL